MSILRYKDSNGQWTELPLLEGPPGMSAYEYAVAGGYDGTIEEFEEQLNAITNIDEAEELGIDGNPIENSNNLITSGGVYSALNDAVATKQDVLTAGENITIINNVISATGGSGSGSGGGSGDYLNKNNPTGTGSLSLNRKPDTTIGNNSVAIGTDNEASGENSFTEGYNTKASGEYSHAEGYTTTAQGNISHAEGRSTTASNYCAHAEGHSSTASGQYSHAEGHGTIASGDYSHAEGEGAIASNYGAHAEGGLTKAKGQESHAEGLYTIASSDSQHVQGKYNVEDTNGQYADIVGWGTGMGRSERANISALTTSGDLRLAGNVYVGCNSDSTGGTMLGSGGHGTVTLKYWPSNGG